jgi:hypothetical protein
MGKILVECENKVTFTEGNSEITVEVRHKEGNVLIKSGDRLLDLDLKTLNKLPDKVKVPLMPWYPSNSIPASGKARIFGLMNLLKEMGGLGERFVSKDEFIKKAEERGVPTEVAKNLIEEMKDKGDMYEPKRGVIQTSQIFSKIQTE